MRLPMKRMQMHACRFVFLLAASTAAIFAQTITGSISGSVLDNAGSAVVAARLKLVQPATGMERTGQTYDITQFPYENMKGAKNMRIESLEPIVANGMFHIISSCSDFLQEMEDYPYGARVDCLDVCGYLKKYTVPKGNPPPPKPLEGPLHFNTILKELEGYKRHEYPFNVQLSEGIV